LVDQLAIIFEELDASATEDELAAEQAVARPTNVRGFTRRPAERNTFPDHLPRERVVIDPPPACALLLEAPASETRRRRDAHAGIAAASVESDRDRARKVHLPGLRDDQPGACAVPFDTAGVGGTEPAGDDRVRKVRATSASEPPGERYALEGAPIALSTMADAVGAGLRGARSPSVA